MKSTLLSLLGTWGAGLLAHQIAEGPDRGGLGCPDCARVHGRCADAIYPFLTLAGETGDERYVRAAIEVFDWSERHVSQPDGSYVNDVAINDWTGITVFSTLALAEALHFHGDLLPGAVRAAWTERLRRGAAWIAGVDWANHGTINYPASAAAALASASRVLDDENGLELARGWANWTRPYFLPGRILFGEGPRAPTPRGVYAVDALYNLEESLPNLALYAEISGDTAIRELVLRSFEAHLPFLLPDGSYDAGWCSRAFKWTLWGSRTSDGLAGLLPLAPSDPRIATAAARNLDLLRRCTHDGLLHGGPHLQNHGRPPCIHHTFAHAKALAAALKTDFEAPSLGKTELPPRTPGIDSRPELGVALVSVGPWRASFSTSDVFYGARGSHAGGGALTMLWHPLTGPLCVSSMSRYDLPEPGNMAAPRAADEIAVLTPRLQSGEFSSELDWHARLETGAQGVTASGHLTNIRDETERAFSIETRFEPEGVRFQLASNGATFVLPLVSSAGEAVRIAPHRIEIRKPDALVVCQSNAVFRAEEKRIFHFVPGVQAVRLEIEVPPEGAWVSLRVEAL